MLEEVRERTSSVLVSALGSWLGLGAGLALMVFSLMAVSWLVLKGDSSGGRWRLLNHRLERDLTSLQPGGAALSDDGLTLTLVTSSEDRSATVYYEIRDRRLTRTSILGDTEFIARLDELKFSLQGDRLVAEWRENGASRTENWALTRWSKP